MQYRAIFIWESRGDMFWLRSISICCDGPRSWCPSWKCGQKCVSRSCDFATSWYAPHISSVFPNWAHSGKTFSVEQPICVFFLQPYTSCHKLIGFSWHHAEPALIKDPKGRKKSFQQFSCQYYCKYLQILFWRLVFYPQEKGMKKLEMSFLKVFTSKCSKTYFHIFCSALSISIPVNFILKISCIKQ